MRRTAPALLLLGLASGVAAHEPRPSRYTYWGDVRPILERHCTSCHSPEGSGPMSLARYRDILPWAAGVQREVLERRMPPWAPEDGRVAYRGERILTAREIDVLVDWITGATPEGDVPAEPRAAARLVEEEPEPPDRVVEIPPVVLDADTFETTACRVVQIGADAAVWLRGVALEPGARRTLRRATLWKGESCSGSTPPLFQWVPGQTELAWPAGAAERLEADDELALRLEYRKTWDDDGVRVEDRSRLLLRVASGPGQPPRRRAADGEPLPAPLRLLALLPESDGDGTLEVSAESPGGGRVVLLEVRRPDPIWLGRYELAEPLHLPAGTVLRSGGGHAWVELLPAGVQERLEEQHLDP